MELEELKQKNEQLEREIVGLLHDIGKIGVPDEILNKPSRLSEEEFEIIKSHPVIGEEILEIITMIPDIARIIAVADAYDAMTSTRSYRGVMPKEKVRKEIEKGKGTQFDPFIADKMLELIDEDVDYEMHE